MKMKFPIVAGFLAAGIALLAFSCKKPTAFGQELIDDYADYAFTDTITVNITQQREDSVITSDRIGSAARFLCGEINDPILGTYRSDLYTLIQPVTLNPDFESVTLDSIVLYLAYASSGIYGDTLQPQTLSVYRLDGSLTNDSTYFSNATIQAGMEIGRLDNFLPRPTSIDSLFEDIQSSFIRVKLDDTFGNELLGLDSLSWISDSSFYQKLRGLKIVSTSNGANPGAMLAFDLNNNSASRVAMYYRITNDTIQKRFDFYMRSTNKYTAFDHNFSGSEVEPVIGQAVTDKMYLQGMQGLRLKVEFPYANLLDRVAVNKAQLVLTVADDNPYLLPAEQLVFTVSVGDTAYNFSSDVLYSLGSSGTGDLSTFGGFPEDEILNGNTTLTRYRLTLSELFQHIIDDDVTPDIKNRTVYINVYPRNRSSQRTILFGPQSMYPPKLELKYTRVQ
ncbi:MAG: DUF4270 family protein [Lewinellaceae bacterium]|nr:DUF4270 family protein [Saprospiraceae bacterium]MCB9343197.1 DUF4270 family protein [Lewinellaceae bacterium]